MNQFDVKWKSDWPLYLSYQLRIAYFVIYVILIEYFLYMIVASFIKILLCVNHAVTIYDDTIITIIFTVTEYINTILIFIYR